MSPEAAQILVDGIRSILKHYWWFFTFLVILHSPNSIPKTLTLIHKPHVPDFLKKERTR